MKKIISLILACIMVASCFAVAFADGEPTAIVTDQSSEYILFCHYSGYSFWQDVWQGFNDAAQIFGVKATFGGTAGYELTEVLSALDQTIASKPAGIAVTAMDADTYIDPINKGIASGVPIVTFDTDSPDSDRYAFVGTNNYSSGAAAANWIANHCDGTGSVILSTNINNSNFIDRNNGFIDTLAAKCPDMNVVTIQQNLTGGDSSSDIKAALLANPDTKYIFTTAGGATTYAVTAVNELGVQDSVKLITFDTEEAVLDWIEDGTVECSISQSPYCMGWWSLVYLYFLSHEELVTPAENWREAGFPFLPDVCDSGSMTVTADTTYLFRRTYDYTA